MIITRAPLRLPLGGGGTDLPSYYRRGGGSWLSAALDLEVEVQVDPLALDEPAGAPRAQDAGSEGDPLVRTACARRAATASSLAVRLHSPVPAGTGLGSSGSLCVALELALAMHAGERPEMAELAEHAHSLEVEALGPTAGKQDPWIAATGGITWFEVDRGGEVRHRPAAIDVPTVVELERRLVLFATGGTRDSSELLGDQRDRTLAGDDEMIRNLERVEALGRASREALEAGDLDRFGALLHDHWTTKRARSAGMTTDRIDRWYRLALDHGAAGGKLVGAGGAGYLLFCAEDPGPLRTALRDAGLSELPFRFSRHGARVVCP